MFDISWEEKYAKCSYNRYPYGELVSVFFNSLNFLKNKISDIKVLEVGCGAGNNLWFIAEQGYDTYGIDGSKTACKIAKKETLRRGVDVRIEHSFFDNLPFKDNFFDMVVDREATYAQCLNDIKKSWRELNRVTKRGGVIIAFLFADDSPDLLNIKNGKLKAKKIENNTYTDIEEGTFKNTGIVHFFSYNEILELFSFLNIKFINKHKCEPILNNCENKYYYSEWIVVGTKK